MIPILDHVWGLSPASDRVWAQVSGMSPLLAGEQRLMILQAFIDDSKGKDGAFVLAGYIASAETWAKFAKRWEELLPLTRLVDQHGRRYFKMSELAMTTEGMELISQAFFRVIEDTAMLAISCKINANELKRAIERVVPVVGFVDWGQLANPYILAFRGLLDGFHNNKEELVDTMLPKGIPVDFIFDEQQGEKELILSAWNGYLATRDENTKHLYGATPRFESEFKFLPLQAADFWAWWVRHWYETKQPFLEFGSWSKTKGKIYYVMEISFNEENIVTSLVDLLRNYSGPGLTILDRKTGNLI